MDDKNSDLKLVISEPVLWVKFGAPTNYDFNAELPII